MHKSTGLLKYSDGYRLVLEADPEIARFYRSLIPPWMTVNKPAWPAHITVVRFGREVPLKKAYWNAHHGEKVTFQYSPTIHVGETYYWLNCFCKRLEAIREELGLPVVSQYTLPPEGFERCFHMTIGNKKEQLQST